MRITGWFLSFIVIVGSVVLTGCQPKSESPDPDQLASVRDDVKAFAATVAHDVTAEGPKAWHKFFAHSPQFYMASNGQLVFPNIDSATVFVDSLTVWVRSIHLEWSDISVDPLSRELALFRASYHEVITESSGRQMLENGYCTATVEQADGDWKFRNLHWSTIGGNESR